MITIIVIIIIVVFIQFWLILGFYRPQEIQTDLTWLQRKRSLAEPTWYFVMWSWMSQKFRHTELHRVFFIVFELSLSAFISSHTLSISKLVYLSRVCHNPWYTFFPLNVKLCMVESLPEVLQSTVTLKKKKRRKCCSPLISPSYSISFQLSRMKLWIGVNVFCYFFLHNDLLGIINIIVASQGSLPLWIVLVVWLTDCFKTKLSRVVMLLCTSLHLWHYFRPG